MYGLHLNILAIDKLELGWSKESAVLVRARDHLLIDEDELLRELQSDEILIIFGSREGLYLSTYMNDLNLCQFQTSL